MWNVNRIPYTVCTIPVARTVVQSNMSWEMRWDIGVSVLFFYFWVIRAKNKNEKIRSFFVFVFCAANADIPASVTWLRMSIILTAICCGLHHPRGLDWLFQIIRKINIRTEKLSFFLHFQFVIIFLVNLKIIQTNQSKEKGEWKKENKKIRHKIKIDSI